MPDSPARSPAGRAPACYSSLVLAVGVVARRGRTRTDLGGVRRDAVVLGECPVAPLVTDETALLKPGQNDADTPTPDVRRLGDLRLREGLVVVRGKERQDLVGLTARLDVEQFRRSVVEPVDVDRHMK